MSLTLPAPVSPKDAEAEFSSKVSLEWPSEESGSIYRHQYDVSFQKYVCLFCNFTQVEPTVLFLEYYGNEDAIHRLQLITSQNEDDRVEYECLINADNPQKMLDGPTVHRIVDLNIALDMEWINILKQHVPSAPKCGWPNAVSKKIGEYEGNDNEEDEEEEYGLDWWSDGAAMVDEQLALLPTDCQKSELKRWGYTYLILRSYLNHWFRPWPTSSEIKLLKERKGQID